MLSSTIRTIVTGKASIGLATLALLGGGAALAATDSPPPDEAPPEFAPVPLDTVPPEVAAEPEVPADQDVLVEDLTDGPEDLVSELTAGSEQADEPVVAEVEDDGPGWALGRAADTEMTQQNRVVAFCADRQAEARENGEGVPPFCTTGGEGNVVVPPNEFGQRMAEAARSGERGAGNGVEGAGRPSWAGPGATEDGDEVESSGRAEGAGPPAGVPRGRPGSDG